MIYLDLFISFFKIGLFSIGGGLAMLPLIHDEVMNHGWLSSNQFVDMIAISESTPGPIGINMATYVGYKSAGIPGALIGTFATVLPSMIITVIIAHWFMKFNEKPVVVSAFKALRPASTGLIAAAAFLVAKVSLFNLETGISLKNIFQWADIKVIVLCIVLIIIIRKWERHPIFYILISAVIGIVFKF